VAALLHDAPGGPRVPREIIADTFGEEVAKVVAAVTDDRALPKAERRRHQVESPLSRSESPLGQVSPGLCRQTPRRKGLHLSTL
jgi:hypothetical protein